MLTAHFSENLTGMFSELSTKSTAKTSITTQLFINDIQTYFAIIYDNMNVICLWFYHNLFISFWYNYTEYLNIFKMSMEAHWTVYRNTTKTATIITGNNWHIYMFTVQKCHNYVYDHVIISRCHFNMSYFIAHTNRNFLWNSWHHFSP